MSIADRFSRVENAGFVRSYDPRIARWQFQISLALIAILTVAAFVLGFSFQGGDSTKHRPPVTSTHSLLFAKEPTGFRSDTSYASEHPALNGRLIWICVKCLGHG
jgi:hypothetical protein